ncbi:MAG: hypothetical protein ACRBCL_04030 [Maritimibacter sp.]
MSDISGVISAIAADLEDESVNWQSFSLVLEVNQSGKLNGNSGYAYDANGAFTAIAVNVYGLRPAMHAYLEGVYGDTPFPVRMLLQFDRSTGQFKTLFEDKDTSRWAVTPADIHGYIDRMRPRFDE